MRTAAQSIAAFITSINGEHLQHFGAKRLRANTASVAIDKISRENVRYSRLRTTKRTLAKNVKMPKKNNKEAVAIAKKETHEESGSLSPDSTRSCSPMRGLDPVFNFVTV